MTNEWYLGAQGVELEEGAPDSPGTGFGEAWVWLKLHAPVWIRNYLKTFCRAPPPPFNMAKTPHPFALFVGVKFHLPPSPVL